MSANQQVLLGLGTGVDKILTFQASASDIANLTTYTFSAQAIGAAAADRRVIVAVHAHGNTGITISSATIGGVAADISIQNRDASSVSGILIALVPTGTTADVVVTFNAGKARAAIGVWSCTGLTSNTANSTATSLADPTTATLTTTNGGFCIAAVTNNDQFSTLTWTNVTERYDAAVEAAMTASGADADTIGANISPSGAFAGAPGEIAGVFATW